MTDHGGEIHAYIARIGDPIPDRCYSACTVLLAGACVPRGAVLYFHKASSTVGTMLMQSYYSDRLNAYIERRGGLRSSFMPISARRLSKLGYRVCGE